MKNLSGATTRFPGVIVDLVRERPWAVAVVAGFLWCFVWGGDPAPSINESHYYVKAKNFWDPGYLPEDIFADSGKAHATFDAIFGWPTRWFSLATSVWIGRIAAWVMLSVGLARFCRAALGRAMAAVWVMPLWIVLVHHTNLAGEWVVGGVEAKVPAYALVLLGLAEVVRLRFDRGWIWFGAASAIHVLTGGWAVLATLLAYGATQWRNPDRPPLGIRGLMVGGVLALAGVGPAMATSWAADPSVASAAAAIYVYVRLPHHLLATAFEPGWFVRHAMLTGLTGGAMWWTLRGRRSRHGIVTARIRMFTAVVVGSLALSAMGLMLSFTADPSEFEYASLLRFYWFRLADALVPLLAAILIAAWLRPPAAAEPLNAGQHGGASQHVWTGQRMAAAFVFTVAMIAFSMDVVRSASHRIAISGRSGLLGWRADDAVRDETAAYLDWQKACRWVRGSTAASDAVLTPRHQQTFKWFAARKEVVNWKDVPQDAVHLNRWYARFRDVFPSRLGGTKVTIGYQPLRRYRSDYGAAWMLVDRRIVPHGLPLPQVYPVDPALNRTYAIYELPADPADYVDLPFDEPPSEGFEAFEPLPPDWSDEEAVDLPPSDFEDLSPEPFDSPPFGSLDFESAFAAFL